MKIKHILSLTLTAAILAAILCSCGNSSTPSSVAPVSSETAVASSAAPVVSSEPAASSQPPASSETAEPEQAAESVAPVDAPAEEAAAKAVEEDSKPTEEEAPAESAAPVEEPVEKKDAELAESVPESESKPQQVITDPEAAYNQGDTSFGFDMEGYPGEEDEEALRKWCEENGIEWVGITITEEEINERGRNGEFGILGEAIANGQVEGDCVVLTPEQADPDGDGVINTNELFGCD